MAYLNDSLNKRLQAIPTPLAALALGISSIGILLDAAFKTNGLVQNVTAIVAGMLILGIALKFLLVPKSLTNDLKHPVVGSVTPTFAMGLMIVSNAIVKSGHDALGYALWLSAVALHITFLVTFLVHRLKRFQWEEMVPSWFIPPVGIVVAAVSYYGPQHGILYNVATYCMYTGLIAYAVMLPMMFYRLIFKDTIHSGAQPTIAILAAPASLTMAGYLSLIPSPSVLIVLVLFGIALLMTLIVYVAFTKLLFLPFTPGFAAFTFPMAIGATALFKAAYQLSEWGVSAELVDNVLLLANIELALGTLVITYVSVRFIHHFGRRKVPANPV